jgi:hypothetical protein
VRPALLGAALLALAAAAPAAGADPVTLLSRAPARAAAHAAFTVRVTVAAGPDAFAIATGPLRLRVRLAPECGATFAGTAGRTAIDRRLSPEPAVGVRYRATLRGRVRERAFGTYAVCAFLEQRSDSRQLATDVDTVVAVTRRCTAATRRLARARRALAHARTPARRRILRRRATRARAAVRRACG